MKIERHFSYLFYFACKVTWNVERTVLQKQQEKSNYELRLSVSFQWSWRRLIAWESKWRKIRIFSVVLSKSAEGGANTTLSSVFCVAKQGLGLGSIRCACKDLFVLFVVAAAVLQGDLISGVGANTMHNGLLSIFSIVFVLSFHFSQCWTKVNVIYYWVVFVD